MLPLSRVCAARNICDCRPSVRALNLWISKRTTSAHPFSMTQPSLHHHKTFFANGQDKTQQPKSLMLFLASDATKNSLRYVEPCNPPLHPGSFALVLSSIFLESNSDFREPCPACPVRTIVARLTSPLSYYRLPILTSNPDFISTPALSAHSRYGSMHIKGTFIKVNGKVRPSLRSFLLFFCSLGRPGLIASRLY